MPATDVVWAGGAYACSVAMHSAGSVTLHVQHGFQDLANSPLGVTVLPGPLDAAQVQPLAVWGSEAVEGCMAAGRMTALHAAWRAAAVVIGPRL